MTGNSQRDLDRDDPEILDDFDDEETDEVDAAWEEDADVEEPQVDGSVLVPEDPGDGYWEMSAPMLDAGESEDYDPEDW